MGSESGRKGQAMPIKVGPFDGLVVSTSYQLLYLFSNYPLNNSSFTPMAVPLIGHQFNCSDVILGRKIFPTSATFMIPSGSKISREDKRQHGVSCIGWGMNTYPDNNKVFPL